MLDHLCKFGGYRRPVVVTLLRQRSSSIPLGHPKLIYHRHESEDRIALTFSFNARCCHQSWHVLVILAQLWMLKEGQVRGLVRINANGQPQAPAEDTRPSPFYWAGFVLSGDWR